MNIPSRLFHATLTLGLAAVASLTSAPAATWDTVPLGGGGFVTGLASNADGSAIYARTDVGGVFRWVPTGDTNGNGSWLSLSDNQVPFVVEGAEGVMSVESLATDPNDLNRLYTGADDAIWGSDDRGSTWYVVPNSPVFHTGGNEGHRWTGERLAIDPNNSNILWYGSRQNGLQKGVKQTDGSWVWTVIPSTSVPWGRVPVQSPPLAKGGVIFVACDKNNGGTTITYAGVYDTVDTSATTTGGIYKSTDSGSTWSKVTVSSGEVIYAPRRGQVASDGTFYVTTGGGGVFKLARSVGTLAKVTTLPTGVTYGGLAIDPNDSQKVYVADGDSVKIYRTANGGTSWNVQSSITQTRQEPDGTPCMTGYWFGGTSSLLINPANSNELWLGDLFGVSRTRNAQDLGLSSGSIWYTLQKGQEETVVFALKNAPTGPQLMVGDADVGGFRYTDITTRPTGAGGKAFTNPIGPNNTSIDFSESNPNVWARTHVESDGNGGGGAVSVDGGLTWATFGQLAYRSINNSTAAGWESFDIAPYLQRMKAANPNAVVTLVVNSGSWDTGASGLTFSSREGGNAPQVLVNGTTTLVTTADVTARGGYPDTNFGADSALLGSSYYGTINRSIYLKFDLSTAPAVITSAMLRLYRLAGTDTLTYPTAIYAEDVTSWTESALTWNNRPLYNSRAGIYVSTIPAVLGTTGGGGGGRVAVSATDPNTLVWMPIGSGTVSHYSTDRGVTWTASTGGPGSQITGVYNDTTSSGCTAQPLTSDRVNGNFYLAAFSAWDNATSATRHNVYRSTDGGKTWTLAGNVANNNYNARTPQLVAAPAANDVWLCDDGAYNGTGGGLWHSTNGGTSWPKITGVSKVTAISFGKANAGSTYPYAVYIYGYVGSPAVKGVYRSADLGANWVRLLDPTIEGSPVLVGDRQNAESVFLGTGGRGVFHYNAGIPPDIILDNAASTGVTKTGTWTSSVYTPGYYGTDYIHDGNTAKGSTSVRFTPTLPSSGNYTVYARWTADTNRATNVPIEIVASTGTTTVTVNMQATGATWVSLGTYAFTAGTAGSVRISNTGTNGFVIADAVRFLKQ